MKDEPEVRTYFAEHIPASRKPGLVRVTNALIRGGFATMDDVCAASDERIRKVRNLGEKSFEIVVMMREKYAGGKAKTQGTQSKGGQQNEGES